MITRGVPVLTAGEPEKQNAELGRGVHASSLTAEGIADLLRDSERLRNSPTVQRAIWRHNHPWSYLVEGFILGIAMGGWLTFLATTICCTLSLR